MPAQYSLSNSFTWLKRYIHSSTVCKLPSEQEPFCHLFRAGRKVLEKGGHGVPSENAWGGGKRCQAYVPQARGRIQRKTTQQRHTSCALQRILPVKHLYTFQSKGPPEKRDFRVWSHFKVALGNLSVKKSKWFITDNIQAAICKSRVSVW